MLNAQEQKPAIVQLAARNWSFYEKAIIQLDDHKGKMLKEYKESGVWKEHYKSWAAACVPFELSRRRCDELIQMEVGGKPPAKPNKSDKTEEESLKQVEKAREETKEEEPEKPAVHSADEKKQDEPKPHTNGHGSRKSENGKPKQLLAAWREMEESLIGRAINRTDELNRLCPNPQMHARLVASLKASLLILEQWKQSVQ